MTTKVNEQTIDTEQLRKYRADLHNRLLQLCAARLQRQHHRGRTTADQLLGLWIKVELLQVTVDALVTALLSTKLIDLEKFQVTQIGLMQERLKQIEQESPGVIVAAKMQ